MFLYRKLSSGPLLLLPLGVSKRAGSTYPQDRNHLVNPPAGQPSVTPSAEPQLPESDRLPIGDRRLVAFRYALF